MLVHKMTGYDAPVTVWPAEFRAAAALEARSEETKTQSLTLSSSRRRGSNPTEQRSLLDPRVREDDKKEVGYKRLRESTDAQPEIPT